MIRTRPRRRAATIGVSATLAACLLASARAPSAVAQALPGTPAAALPDSSTRHSAATTIGLFVLGSALSVYSHETGHWVFAHLTGATSARLTLVPPGMQARFPAGASTFQRTFPTLAGPLTTRLLAEGVDHVLNATSPSRPLEAIGGATYLAMRADLPFQVLSSTVRQCFPGADHAHDDIAAGLVLPYFQTRGARNLVYAALMASQIVDVWLDAGEIADNFRRFTGRPGARRRVPRAGLSLVSDPASRALGIRFDAPF